jgi:hypothetical protein
VHAGDLNWWLLFLSTATILFASRASQGNPISITMTVPTTYRRQFTHERQRPNSTILQSFQELLQAWSSVGCTRERRTAGSCCFRQLPYSCHLEHESETCHPGPLSPTARTGAKTVTYGSLRIAHLSSSIRTGVVVSSEPSQVPSLSSISVFTPPSKKTLLHRKKNSIA